MCRAYVCMYERAFRAAGSSRQWNCPDESNVRLIVRAREEGNNNIRLCGAACARVPPRLVRFSSLRLHAHDLLFIKKEDHLSLKMVNDTVLLMSSLGRSSSSFSDGRAQEARGAAAFSPSAHARNALKQAVKVNELPFHPILSTTKQRKSPRNV